MSLPCASIDGTPAPIAPSLLPVSTCSRCMTSVESLKLCCRRWVLTIPDCQWHVTQLSSHNATFRPHACTYGRRSATTLHIHPSPVQSQQSSQFAGVPFQQPNASGPTRTTAAARDQQVQIEAGTVHRTPSTPTQYEHRAMEHNANGPSMGEWYVWYFSLEVLLVNLCSARSSLGSSHQPTIQTTTMRQLTLKRRFIDRVIILMGRHR